jgi:hypothetical protein
VITGAAGIQSVGKVVAKVAREEEKLANKFCFCKVKLQDQSENSKNNKQKKINKYGKIKWKFELYSATACGGYAFKCGGSPVKILGFRMIF